MDIPLPEDIPFPGDEESPNVAVSTEDICNIKLPDDINENSIEAESVEKAEGELIEKSSNVDNNEVLNECYDDVADGSVEVTIVGQYQVSTI